MLTIKRQPKAAYAANMCPDPREKYNAHNERPAHHKIGNIMNKVDAFKFVARVIVGAGTGTITGSIIKNNVQPSNMVEQVSTAVAAVVIGSMAQEATRSHTDAKIDQVIELWNNAKNKDVNAEA